VAVSRLSGAHLVRIPGDVGASRAASTYEAYVDELVRAVAGALGA
jgi:hypothetical protein